jgi:hypothetical protein
LKRPDTLRWLKVIPTFFERIWFSLMLFHEC